MTKKLQLLVLVCLMAFGASARTTTLEFNTTEFSSPEDATTVGEHSYENGGVTLTFSNGYYYSGSSASYFAMVGGSSLKLASAVGGITSVEIKFSKNCSYFKQSTSIGGTLTLTYSSKSSSGKGVWTPRGTTYTATFYNKATNTSSSYDVGITKIVVTVETDDSYVATPCFTPLAGTYTCPQDLTSTDVTDGAIIYYTTDGTEPDESSSESDGSIPVRESCTVKAVAILNLGDSSVRSDVVSAEYVIQPEDPYMYGMDGSYEFEEFDDNTNTVIFYCSDSIRFLMNGCDSAAIYYTLDGSEPTAESSKAERPYEFLSVAATEWVKPSGTATTVTLKFIAICGNAKSNVIDAGTVVLKPIRTLTEFIKFGGIGSTFTLTGANLQSVYHFTDSIGNKFLVVRDSDPAADLYCDLDSLYADYAAWEAKGSPYPVDKCLNLLTDSLGNVTDQTRYPQSNWLLVLVNDADYDKVGVPLAQIKGYCYQDTPLRTIDATGYYDEGRVWTKEGWDKMMELDASADGYADACDQAYGIVGEAADLAADINTYTPVNFNLVPINVYYGHRPYMYSPLVMRSKADSLYCFFMPPKQGEIASITWLVADEYGAFRLPDSSYYNPYGWNCGIAPYWDFNEAGTVSLTEGQRYEMTAIIGWTPYGKPISEKELRAPRRASSTISVDDYPYWNGCYAGWYSNLTENGMYYIYPIDVADEKSIVTGVSDIQGRRQVQSVRYYDLAGRSSAQPFEGVNVVETRYTDGTRSVRKELR